MMDYCHVVTINDDLIDHLSRCDKVVGFRISEVTVEIKETSEIRAVEEIA